MATRFPFDTRPLRAKVEFHARRLITPLVLSTGRIDEVFEARAEVEVEVDGLRAVGRGANYLSDLWSWPDPRISANIRQQRMRNTCVAIAASLFDACGRGAAHPTELGIRLHATMLQTDLVTDMVGMPRLARILCASPFDAAIHDAVGRALRRSALSLYDEALLPSVDAMFAPEGAAAAIRRLLDRPPRRVFPATFVVAAEGPLDELLAEWVGRRRYGRVKLKLHGRDPAVDAHRTAEVETRLRLAGIATPWISVDTNEASPDAATVLEYLERLATDAPRAYQALQYLEQPTSRDFRSFPQDWRSVTQHKPVLLDEGLSSLDDLDEARRQGWSGLAVKTCKGHSFSLVSAAWAYDRQQILALQDLTNPGIGAIHAALLATQLPTINGLELNAPQFTPRANEEFLPEWAPLLSPVDGYHRFPERLPVGLGLD